MTETDTTIEVFRVAISKAELRKIPENERNLLLLASHAVNQLSVMRKLLIFSLNYESPNEIEKTLSAAQSQTILRFLLGSLAEAWEMLKRPVNQKIVGKDYAETIGADGVSAFKNLKTQFGRSSLLHRIRNTVAYHHPEGTELLEAFEETPEGEDWSWYPSDTINNSYYLVSDFVISARIIKLTGESDIRVAFRAVMDLARQTSNDLIDFLLYLMRAIVSRHLGSEVLSLRRGTGITVEGVPNIYNVSIPFFTYRPD